MPPTNIRPATPWAFLPAFLLLAATIVTMAGVSLIPSATAAPATDTETVVVGGTVDGSIAFNAVACGGTGAVNFATGFAAGAGNASLTTPDCALQFNTNNAAGAELLIVDNDGTAPFFCNDLGATCGGNDEFGNQAVDDTALEDDAFAVALVSVAGAGAVRTFDLNDSDTDPQPADPSWYGIDALVGKQVCRNEDPTAGTTCTLRFAGNPEAAQTSGSYQGTALLTASTL